MNNLVAAAMVALAASSTWAIQGTIKCEKGQWSGDITWMASKKTYLVAYKKGKTDVSAECPLADVESLEIPKPAGFDKAVEMVRRGQGSAAIGTLAKIVNDYKMLSWDKPAGRYLVEAYLAANNPQKAFDTAQGIIKGDSDAAWTGDLAPAYWQTLLKLGQNQRLENCLRKATSSGDRPTSAEALLMRGDMILAAGGDLPDTYRKALVDAYLRVALMYPDENCKAVRADAMQKAAGCFDKIGMASRAEQMRSQAKAL